MQLSYDQGPACKNIFRFCIWVLYKTAIFRKSLPDFEGCINQVILSKSEVYMLCLHSFHSEFISPSQHLGLPSKLCYLIQSSFLGTSYIEHKDHAAVQSILWSTSFGTQYSPQFLLNYCDIKSSL